MTADYVSSDLTTHLSRHRRAALAHFSTPARPRHYPFPLRGSQPLSYFRLLAVLYVGDFSLTSNRVKAFKPFKSFKTPPLFMTFKSNGLDRLVVICQACLQLRKLAGQLLVCTQHLAKFDQGSSGRQLS